MRADCDELWKLCNAVMDASSSYVVHAESCHYSACRRVFYAQRSLRDCDYFVFSVTNVVGVLLLNAPCLKLLLIIPRHRGKIAHSNMETAAADMGVKIS